MRNLNQLKKMMQRLKSAQTLILLTLAGEKTNAISVRTLKPCGLTNHRPKITCTSNYLEWKILDKRPSQKRKFSKQLIQLWRLRIK